MWVKIGEQGGVVVGLRTFSSGCFSFVSEVGNKVTGGEWRWGRRLWGFEERGGGKLSSSRTEG